MPGIVGLISKRQRGKVENELRLMIDCMMHEPSYSSGVYINDSLGVYVGWICHEGSFSDCMPIFNEEKNLILIFSGENFADRETITGLRGRGHQFDVDSSSYLIHLFEEEGDKFYQILNGWFCGVLVDLRKNKVALFNDRYSMGRIYFYEGEDEFLFSSEAKALLKVRPELRQVNFEGLGEFFLCGCPLNNKSLYSKIYAMPGGSVWGFEHGRKAEKKSFFRPSDWEGQPLLAKEVSYERLKDTFERILPRYFRAKQKIGLSLTGGLDTRMILAYKGTPPGMLPCYTFGGLQRDTNDVKIPREIAAACGETHEVIRIDESFFKDFPYHAEKTIYVTDGNFDICGSHEMYLNKRAAQIAPIRMTGNYGSEVLRSVSTFKKTPMFEEVFNRDFNKYLSMAEEQFDNMERVHRLHFTVFREIPWHLYGWFNAADSQLTFRTPYMDNELVKLLFQVSQEVRCSNNVSMRLISDGSEFLSQFITDRGMRIDRPSLFGKIHHLVEEIAFKAEYFTNVGMPSWSGCSEKILELLGIEKLLLGRQQFLFYGKWFRRELGEYIQGVLLESRSVKRPYLNGKILERVVKDHLTGKCNYLNEIDKLVSAELVYRLLIENA